MFVLYLRGINRLTLRHRAQQQGIASSLLGWNREKCAFDQCFVHHISNVCLKVLASTCLLARRENLAQSRHQPKKFLILKPVAVSYVMVGRNPGDSGHKQCGITGRSQPRDTAPGPDGSTSVFIYDLCGRYFYVSGNIANAW